MKRLIMAATLIGTMLTPALAIDFATPIKQLDGEPMRKDDKQIFTLNDAVQNALLATYQDEPNLDGVEKSRRFWLAKKINDQRKDPPVTSDEIALIKKLIAKAFNPLVVGRAWDMLDPASTPK